MSWVVVRFCYYVFIYVCFKLLYDDPIVWLCTICVTDLKAVNSKKMQLQSKDWRDNGRTKLFAIPVEDRVNVSKLRSKKYLLKYSLASMNQYNVWVTDNWKCSFEVSVLQIEKTCTPLNSHIKALFMLLRWGVPTNSYLGLTRTVSVVISRLLVNHLQYVAFSVSPSFTATIGKPWRKFEGNFKRFTTAWWLRGSINQY